jgi:hypothetical protein
MLAFGERWWNNAIKLSITHLLIACCGPGLLRPKQRTLSWRIGTTAQCQERPLHEVCGLRLCTICACHIFRQRNCATGFCCAANWPMPARRTPRDFAVGDQWCTIRCRKVCTSSSERLAATWLYSIQWPNTSFPAEGLRKQTRDAPPDIPQARSGPPRRFVATSSAGNPLLGSNHRDHQPESELERTCSHRSPNTAGRMRPPL